MSITAQEHRARMMAWTRFDNLLDNVEYKHECETWYISLKWDDNRMYLQVSSVESAWTGRKWFVSPHMCDSEFVQTALRAVLAAHEHEVRESFFYKGQPIFGPHFNVDFLAETLASGRKGVRQGRSDSMEGL